MELSDNDPDYEGAQLFAERCSGCHTLSAAGTQGTANRSQRVQGPDFDQRTETVEDVIGRVMAAVGAKGKEVRP